MEDVLQRGGIFLSHQVPNLLTKISKRLSLWSVGLVLKVLELSKTWGSHSYQHNGCNEQRLE